MLWRNGQTNICSFKPTVEWTFNSQQIAKIDMNVFSMCDSCQELEDVDHFVFHCGKYTTERNRLERTAEDIFCREGCNDVTCINLKLLGGYNENVSSNGQNDLIAALIEFIRIVSTDF